MLRESFLKLSSSTAGYLFEGRRGGGRGAGKHPCCWVAKFNIEMKQLISPVKVILPYFAYVVTAKFHKHTTAAETYIQVPLHCHFGYFSLKVETS